MTADGQRIASFERQVADLAAQLEKYARQAAVVRTLEELFFESRGSEAVSFETTSAPPSRPRSTPGGPPYLRTRRGVPGLPAVPGTCRS
jgi:hypothetical protein